MNVLNDVAVITGAASGIGKAVAEILAARGVTVCIVDFNGNGANEVAASLQMRGYKAFAWQTDVTDSAFVIPRNQRVEEALAAASDDEDLGPFERLLSALRDPYHERAENAHYGEPAPADITAGYRTFCGT